MASNPVKQPLESEGEENQTLMWIRFAVVSVIVLAAVVIPMLFLVPR